MQAVQIQRGLPAHHYRAAALLYDEAFGAKLSAAIPDAESRIGLIHDSFDPGYAFIALAGERLLGLAGIHTSEGSLTGGSDGMGFRQLVRRLGLPQAIRAASVLSLFERRNRDGELLMDGIAVARTARRRGIGTLLLRAIGDFAVAEGYRTVRLDVVDSNPRAKSLYERRGFVATQTERFPILEGLLGFGSSTTMILDLTEPR